LKKRPPPQEVKTPHIPRPKEIARKATQCQQSGKVSSKTSVSKKSVQSSMKTGTKKTYTFEIPNTKPLLVIEVLKRWWYCLPEWPAKDADYSNSLQSQKLRCVDSERFLIENEFDDDDYRKVTPVQGYEGVFINSDVIIPNNSNREKYMICVIKQTAQIISI